MPYRQPIPIGDEKARNLMLSEPPERKLSAIP
jgi:hypothetical protein